jgi:hypothetical protein
MMKYGGRRHFALILVLAMIVGSFAGLQVTSFATFPSTLANFAESTGSWAIIGSSADVAEIVNIAWLFGNQSIPYAMVSPNTVTNSRILDSYVGVVVWTGQQDQYNSTAIRVFAQSKPVIAHMIDFCGQLFPILNKSMQTISTTTMTYAQDWGNFRKGDEVETHNSANQLIVVATDDLSALGNVTVVARVTTAFTSLFYLPQDGSQGGFCVFDLYATNPNSYEPGDWHLFPAIAKASTLKVGTYSRWMTCYGSYWRSLGWVYSWMTEFADSNKDIVDCKSIGISVEGRPINSLFIGKGTRYFIADAAIHGGEKAGTHTLIRFAELLVEWYRSDLNWREKLAQYTIILIPILNPDGYVAETRENANGKDLNRQFPPGAVTTEPEAWALRWLMGNYTPTDYVSLHVGWEASPLNVFYAGSSVEPYESMTWYTLNEGNLTFSDLNHWGLIYGKTWVGKYKYIVRLSEDGGMSPSYAFYKYSTTAILMEHWGSPRANLHFQEYYISGLLSLLWHCDRTEDSLVQSNALILKTGNSLATSLNIFLKADQIAANRTSKTRVFDTASRGKPEQVYIDDILKAENSGWYWTATTGTTTITSAENSIRILWSLPPKWDINQDGAVDIYDALILVNSFGSYPYDPNWNQAADINQDGRIDLVDAIILAAHFGERGP